MFVCEDPKLVIWAPPKTASRSVRQYLKHFAPGKFWEKGWRANGAVFPGHDFPRNSKQRNDVRSNFTDYKFLLLVRNPFRRLTSMYQMMRTNPLPVMPTQLKGNLKLKRQAEKRETEKRIEARTMTFEQWLLKPDLKMPRARPLAVWAESMDRVDGLLRTEHLAVDLVEHTGVTGQLAMLGQSNYGETPWYDLYTPAAVQYVLDNFQKDFERFGYSKNVEDAKNDV